MSNGVVEILMRNHRHASIGKRRVKISDRDARFEDHWPMKFRNTTEPGYFDLQALAVYSSCSVRWLRNRLADHHQPLPHYRVEGKILVKREEFDRWMTTHRTRQPANDVAALVESVVSQMQKPPRTA